MIAKFRSLWQQIQKHRLLILVIIVVLIALVAFAMAVWRFGWDWTGFTSGASRITITSTSKGTTTAKEQQPGKTLWDVLQLLAALAIPVVVGFGAAWFTAQQGKVSERENKDNQRSKVLQDYIDKMSELLLENKLRDSAEDEVRKIARVRTLTVLRSLDAERKGSVLQFLHESGLIDKNKRIIDLSGANLTEVKLNSVNLSKADLSGADLSKADLSGTNLTEANLTRPNQPGVTRLKEANLTGAILSGANLSGAYLEGANLVAANLRGADLRAAFLRGANLVRAKLMGANLHGAILSGAKLVAADLSGADLSRAILRLATMFEEARRKEEMRSEIKLLAADLGIPEPTLPNCTADLSTADLRRANLSDANLKNAIGVTVEELEKQAASLKGATMPDGSIHS